MMDFEATINDLRILNARTLDEYESLIESLRQTEVLLAESEASRRRLVVENQRLRNTVQAVACLAASSNPAQLESLAPDQLIRVEEVGNLSAPQQEVRGTSARATSDEHAWSPSPKRAEVDTTTREPSSPTGLTSPPPAAADQSSHDSANVSTDAHYVAANIINPAAPSNPPEPSVPPPPSPPQAKAAPRPTDPRARPPPIATAPHSTIRPEDVAFHSDAPYFGPSSPPRGWGTSASTTASTSAGLPGFQAPQQQEPYPRLIEPDALNSFYPGPSSSTKAYGAAVDSTNSHKPDPFDASPPRPSHPAWVASINWLPGINYDDPQEREIYNRHCQLQPKQCFFFVSKGSCIKQTCTFNHDLQIHSARERKIVLAICEARRQHKHLLFFPEPSEYDERASKRPRPMY